MHLFLTFLFFIYNFYEFNKDMTKKIFITKKNCSFFTYFMFIRTTDIFQILNLNRYPHLYA